MLSLRNQFSSALKATLIASAVAMSVVANTAASEGRANATVIADCVSATNTRILGFDVKRLKDDKIHVLPNSTARFTLLAGKLGWHTTWTVLLDMDAKPELAFEAYDERLRSGHSSFARRDVPFHDQTRIKSLRCNMARCTI
jgi:hypothetical protein